MSSPQELIDYYAGLLILQYIGKPKAYAHIQTLVTPTIMPQTSVQEISFPSKPDSGTFSLSWDGNPSPVFNWNDSAATIQTGLQTVAGLGSITVSGSIASGSLVVTFVGVEPVAVPLVLVTNSLLDNLGGAIVPTISAIDQTLPLAVQDGFNLVNVGSTVAPYLLPMNNTINIPTTKITYAIATSGASVQTQLNIQTNLYASGDTIYVSNPFAGKSILVNGQGFGGALVATLTVGDWLITILNPADVNGFAAAATVSSPPTVNDKIAEGVQLDVLGDYAGVTRSGNGFIGPITLDDADFLQLIRMAIIKNNSGSSLAEIESLLFDFFQLQILVFDYQNMQMSYLIASSLGSFDLIQLFVTEGILPKPMAVGMSVIYAPVITEFFGFRTYPLPAFRANPFNTYSSYSLVWPWLNYSYAVYI
jgi:hypothetical protein